MSLKSQFLRTHAPAIMAAILDRDRYWPAEERRALAGLACDMTEALHDELRRRYDAELRAADRAERGVERKGSTEDGNG